MRTFLPRSASRRIPAWIVPGSFSWARGCHYRRQRQEKSNSDAHRIRIAFRICVTLRESPSRRRPRPAAAPRSPGPRRPQPRCDHESWKEVGLSSSDSVSSFGHEWVFLPRISRIFTKGFVVIRVIRGGNLFHYRALLRTNRVPIHNGSSSWSLVLPRCHSQRYPGVPWSPSVDSHQ